MTTEYLLSKVDHTLLKPEATLCKALMPVQ